MAQGIEDSGVSVGRWGPRGLVHSVGDEEHGVEIAGPRADVENCIEMDRVGLQAGVFEKNVVVLNGFGNSSFGVLRLCAATEDDCEGLDVGELATLLHLQF